MDVTEPTFCQACGSRLVRRLAHGAERPVCPACGFIHFRDPKVAVGVAVEDGEGRLLYTLRNHEPHQGRWALPGGMVDRGEDVRDAAVREVREETGLEVTLDGLLGVFSRHGDPVVFIAFRGHPVGGSLRVGGEAHDVRFFAASALPPPAFPSDDAVLSAWREGSEADREQRAGPD